MPDDTSTDLPTPSPWVEVDAEAYWEGTLAGQLVLPRCDDCELVIWYPKGFCQSCGSVEVSWFEASGRGVVYACTVTRRAMGPWVDAAPYVLAYVELEEGPRVLTNVVGCEPETVDIGMSVRAVFHPASDRGALLRFEPDGA